MEYEEADAVHLGTKRQTRRAGSRRRMRGAKDEEADMCPQLLRKLFLKVLLLFILLAIECYLM